MTMLRIQTGPTTHAFVHPFLAGARKRETRIPDKHITKKTRREVAAWRVIDFGATRPVQKEKYNRANR